MSDEFLFERFRVRIEKTRIPPPPGRFDLDAITGICRWVSANGLRCFSIKALDDSEELVSFFYEHPHVNSLKEFPEYLCDYAFCGLHGAVAKLHCRDNNVESSDVDSLNKRDDGDKDKLRRAQYLTFGDDDQMQFALGEGEQAPEEQEAIRDIDTREVRLQPKGGSPRAERSLESRYRDGIYSRDVAGAEGDLVGLIQAPFEIKDKTPGYVYVFRDQEINLVKIGFTKKPITTRLGQIQSTCHVGKPMNIVAGENLKPVHAYKQLEKLIHAYLQPHRWFFRCACGKTGNTLHQEYFDVSNKVAKGVFSVWRYFILEDPWPWRLGGSPALYTLRQKWAERIRDWERPSQTERHEDHTIKLKRWRRILSSSGDKDPVSHTADNVDSETEDVTTDLLWSTVEPEDIKRPQSSSPGGHSKRRKMLDDATPSTEGTQATLAAPPQSSKVSRSMPSTPVPNLPATASTPRAAAFDKEAESIKSRTMSLKANDHTMRPATSAGERTLSESSLRPKLRRGGFPSIPTSQFTFDAPVPSRPNIPDQAADKASQVELDRPTTSAERERTTPDKNQSQKAGSTSLSSQSKVDWSTKYMELDQMLHHPREGLPSRTISEDLVQFRWPLAFAVCLAAFSSYIPSFLAWVTWVVFLPCFVADLRSWFPELDRKK